MIRRAYNWAFTHFISYSDPEVAHHWGLGAISLAGRFAPTRGLMRATLGHLDPTHSPTRVVGGVEVPLMLGQRRLPSRLGLAAGMDKDAEAVLGMCALGYAFVEIGTVTPRPQPGNEAPRLWRLMEERGLRNRMGFNNAGADAAAEKLRELRSTPAGRAAIVGANIGKNKVTSEENAPADYEYCAKTLAHWVDFVVVNVSSPNTPGLRDLQSVDHLRPILQAARRGCEAGAPDRVMPLFVKIAPDLADEDVIAVVELTKELGLAGVVATNTTINHDLDEGGVSGAPLLPRALEVVSLVARYLDDEQILIGTGGISSPEDALRTWSKRSPRSSSRARLGPAKYRVRFSTRKGHRDHQTHQRGSERRFAPGRLHAPERRQASFQDRTGTRPVHGRIRERHRACDPRGSSPALLPHVEALAAHPDRADRDRHRCSRRRGRPGLRGRRGRLGADDGLPSTSRRPGRHAASHPSQP